MPLSFSENCRSYARRINQQQTTVNQQHPHEIVYVLRYKNAALFI